jgi:hypothetical protein
MGAVTFSDQAYGKTAEQAFALARERAQWEYGHGGYTGTIAEKGGFVLAVLPPRVSASKLLDWISSEYAFGGDDDDSHFLVRQIAHAKTNARPKKEIAMLERELREQRAASARFWRKVPVQHQALVKRLALSYSDKWGPCVAIECKPSDEKKYAAGSWGLSPKRRGEKLYLFCGWASC